MDKRKPAVQSSWRLVSLLAVSLLGIGVLYYSVARPPSQQPMFTGIGLLYDAAWGNFLGGSLPSFVHALSLLLLLGFWLRNNRVSRQIAVLWYSINLLVLLAIECALGTTTFYDGLAIVLALPLALTVLRMFSVTTAVTSNPNYRLPVLMLCIYSGLGVASYADGYYGSCARYDDEGNCVERIQTASPIYMSYAELRSSVRQEEARPMDDVGRIYAFQNLLYINERNRGIHVIDNADPFDPKPVRFINIPGNLDIEIRGTRLYADSFIDLVTLDISDTDSIVEVDRQVDVFAWDENQNIPYNIELYEDEVDRKLGVIIAYEVN